MAGRAQVFLTLNERLERLVTRVDYLTTQQEAARLANAGLDAAAQQTTRQNIQGLARRIDPVEEQQRKLQDSVDKLIAACEGMEKICEGMKTCLQDYKPRAPKMSTSARRSSVYTSVIKN